MHILRKSSLDNKKVKRKWNSREQGDLRSSSAILSTRVWLYCTSSENRNANALRLTCTHATKTISTQCMMSEGISPESWFLSDEKQQLDPYAWKGFASESITEMRHLLSLSAVDLCTILKSIRARVLFLWLINCWLTTIFNLSLRHEIRLFFCTGRVPGVWRSLLFLFFSHRFANNFLNLKQVEGVCDRSMSVRISF